MNALKAEPGKRTRKDPRREATRTRLIEATLEVLREQGSGGATKAELCRRAGIHRSGFYNYFDSVDALVEEAGGQLGRYVVARDAEMRRAASGAAGSLEQTLEAVRRILALYMQDPGWARHLTCARYEPSLLGKITRETISAATDSLRDDLWITAASMGVKRRWDGEIRRMARMSVDAVMDTMAQLLEAPQEEHAAIVDSAATYIHFAATGTFAMILAAQAREEQSG